MRKQKAKLWGEGHRREAQARNFEVMGELCRANGFSSAHMMLMGCAVNGDSESRWRGYLARADFGTARIDREVRRVRALAEGRLVRETVWRRERDGEVFSTPEIARGGIAQRIVKVTRIRRASR